MKNSIKLLSIAFLFGAIFMSCEGPEGPAGDDGMDGNVTCFSCHDGTTIETVQAQFYTSQHALGDIAVDYAGGRGSCAECHSHQGFVEWALTGDVAENFSAPEAWKCETCHTLHTAFDSTDWSFRAGDAVTLLADETVTLDEGNNNTCINCHQFRRSIGDYDDATTDQTIEEEFTGDEYETYAHGAAMGPAGSVVYDNGVDTIIIEFDVPVTTHAFIESSHAGPHHGPQTNLWAGLGASVTGTAFSSHAGGCVMCHMGEASGHSFKPEIENCAGCHGDYSSDLDEFAARIEAVGEALEALHAVHYSDEDGTYHPMLASLPRAQFQVWWDFQSMLEDRSNGAHNPTYFDSMLDNAETVLGLK